MSMEMRKDGEHHIWLGSLDGRGRPVAFAGKSQVLAHRMLWVSYWGISPKHVHRRRLDRACTAPLCVSPRHWVLAAPGGVYKALGWDRATRSANRKLFAFRGISAAAGRWWRQDSIESRHFAPPSMAVTAMETVYEWPRLAVLAMWSERVRDDRRKCLSERSG